MPAVLSFSQLAEELQVLIISHLDAESILMCREISKCLRDLIDKSVVLQYQLELALLGMVDGPPSTVPPSERLEALCAFKATYSASTYSTEEIIVSESQHREMLLVPSDPAEIAYLDKEGEEFVLNVHRTSSTPCGTPSQSHQATFAGMGPFLAAHPEMISNNLFVDSSQGLLAYTFTTRENDPEGPYMLSHCAFARLSRGRVHWYQLNDLLAPHRSITSCHKFHLPNFLDPRERCFQVQVYGDLVVWRVGEDYDDGSGLSDIIVHNWKMGINVWHMHADRYVGLYRVELLSPSRLVVINSFDLAMRLYDFDPERSTDCPLLRDVDDCRCVLKLPAWLKRAPPAVLSECDTESFITHSPNSNVSETQQAMFLPNPALKTLVFRSEFTYERSQPVDGSPKVAYWREYERYMAFIPVDTLMQFCEDRWPLHASVSDGPDAGASPVLSSAVPWEDWGPTLGARIDYAPEHHRYRPHSVHVRVAGAYTAELSRCYRFTVSSPANCRLSVIEVLPSASPSLPCRTLRMHKAASLGTLAGLDTVAEDWLSTSSLSLSSSDENQHRGPITWKPPFYVTYTIRTVERTLLYITGDRKLFRGVRLVGNKIVVFRSKLHDD
ncbi:hypothetical protein C8Q73DRAFT_692006 [Cubamyces lactineus]|nr:hypothetical protein C8Q73DRAFT_692006 [Cubamyces lactineus]